MQLTDKTLTCGDCGQEFLFTAAEQEFYQARGFSEPKRCRNCRTNRRTEREGGGGVGGARMEREMFDVVCSNCGTPTKVPFQPRGDRPVYCRDCFERVGGGQQRSTGGGGGYGGGRR